MVEPCRIKLAVLLHWFSFLILFGDVLRTSDLYMDFELFSIQMSLMHGLDCESNI